MPGVKSVAVFGMFQTVKHVRKTSLTSDQISRSVVSGTALPSGPREPFAGELSSAQLPTAVLL